MNVPSEHEEQSTLIQWCKLQSGKHPELSMIFAVPNGTYKSKTAQVKYKKEGLKPGVPDLFLPVPAVEYHGLFIEMKRKKGGVLSAQQKDWIEKLKQQGYAVEVCKGAEAAIEKIKKYLNIK